MDKKEQTRLRVQRYRDKQKSVTSDSVTESVTSSNYAEDLASTSKDNPHTETVPASYVQGITGRFKALPKRDRFLTLRVSTYSSGSATVGAKQVLDRLNQPTPNKSGDQAMQACNEGAYNFKPNQSSKDIIKQLLRAAS